MVAEGRVLLGVEHLEHRRRRVAAVVRAHLVDLVDHEQRVVRARVAQRADDHAGHRADVGPPVAADLGLVAHAAHRDALEPALEGGRDRAPERSLADARRPDEAQDRAARVRLQAPDGEELDDAVLDALDVVVVGVEHLARVAEVEVVLGRRVPRQRRDPLEIVADHAVLGRRLRQPLEPRELAVGDLAHLLGQLDLRELLAQLLDLGLGRVALPELLLDRLELLAQQVLALGLVELGLHLGLDARAHGGDLELVGEDLRQAPQPLGDVALLEQLLLDGRVDPQGAGDQVRERRGVVEVGDRELQLLGEIGRLLDDARERLLAVAHQRGQLRALADDVGRLGDAGDEVGRLVRPTRRCGPAGRPRRGSAASRPGP